MSPFSVSALSASSKTARACSFGAACAGVLAMLAVSGPASAQTRAQPAAASARPAAAASSAQQQQPNVPANEVLLILIRSTLDALAQANLTNNYSVLHALGSVNFQRTTTVEQLQKNFAPLRANGVNLLPLVLLSPQLVARPVVQDGRLRLTGLYPTQPARVSFDMAFEPSQGQWRLQGLNVSLTAAPAATPPAGGTADKPATPTPQPRPSR